MNYPPNFAKDMQLLARYYQWNEEAKREVRASFIDCEPMVRYFTILAAGHRAGYKQDAGNGFVRLQNWRVQQALGDPFAAHFDPVALDALTVPERSP
jgi:hypothetical protein